MNYGYKPKCTNRQERCYCTTFAVSSHLKNAEGERFQVSSCRLHVGSLETHVHLTANLEKRALLNYYFVHELQVIVSFDVQLSGEMTLKRGRCSSRSDRSSKKSYNPLKMTDFLSIDK